LDSEDVASPRLYSDPTANETVPSSEATAQMARSGLAWT
jgi:hypothetical protein